MASVKRRRESDETGSSPTPTIDVSPQVEAPVDHTMRSWLATEDGRYFSDTVKRMLENDAPHFGEVLKTTAQTAPKAICDEILGQDRNRVLANIADLRTKKGLDPEDLALQIFVDPYRGMAGPFTPYQTDLVREDFTNAVVASWGEAYHGNADNALWNYICHNFRPNVAAPVDPAESNEPASFYAHYIVLFQSSGTGKSRLIDELAKRTFLIPICLRGQSSGYPPADVEVRAYLNDGTTRTAAYARCWGFMQALFRHTADVLRQGDFKGLNYTDTAGLFRTKLTEDMKKVHNAYRQKFFKDVIEKADAHLQQTTSTFEKRKESAPTIKPRVSPKGLHGDGGHEGTNETTDTQKTQSKENASSSVDLELLRSLLEAWSELNNVLEGKELGNRPGPLVLLSFDEAHDLTKIQEATHIDPYSWSTFRELRATLRALNNCSIFSIFLSTSERFSQITPLSQDDPSARVYNHSLKLIPPYCDLGLDVLPLAAKEKQDLSGKWTLRRVVAVQYMASLGRPMFGLMYQKGSEGVRSDSLRFAMQKLTNKHDGVPLEMNMDQATACLGFRLPFEFLSTTYINKDKELSQVEGHLRICLKPNAESESMVTISPSEPFVSEAAARLLATTKWEGSKKPVNPIEILKELMTGFSIHTGDRGEFVALLLLTLARDKAVRQAAPEPPAERIFFLTLDFPNAMMHFNHFIKPHQQKIIHRDFLLLLMGRGAGVLCATNTPAIDFVIPFLVEGDSIQSSNFGAIVGQVKNDRKFTHKAKPKLFDEMHPRKIGLLRKGDPAVPLIRIFMALSSFQSGVTIVRHEPTADYNAIVYDIWIAGLTPGVYAGITQEDQSIWRAALAATQAWEAIYRVPQQAPEMRAVRQSSHAGAADRADHWNRWVDLATTGLKLNGENDSEDESDDGQTDEQEEQGQSKASTSKPRVPKKKRAKLL